VRNATDELVTDDKSANLIKNLICVRLGLIGRTPDFTLRLPHRFHLGAGKGDRDGTTTYMGR
jgi:hypothetical protein